MKSRVSIDVDHDNQPVIKIEYSPSEDVRDKLVKKFLESYGGSSRWAEFFFINDSQSMSTAIHGQANSTALVRPLSIFNMMEQKKSIDYSVNEHLTMLKNIGHPLSPQESQLVNDTLPLPLADCLRELKAGRPEAQEILDKCIAEIELKWPQPGSTTANLNTPNTFTHEKG